MHDLNDLYWFMQVVEHRGFAAAGRALDIPKSRLSRRIGVLEQQLGVRLLQRSTRRFAVTEIGQIYYGHCRAMVAEAQAAQEAIDRTRSEPQGTVRVSCPMLLAQGEVGHLITRFLAAHPLVRVNLDATNRRVDVIEEGYDLALRVRKPPLEDSDLVVKILAPDYTVLVASPAFLDHHGRPSTPTELGRLDSLSMSQRGGDYTWRLIGPDDVALDVAHTPRLVTDEMLLLRRAALDGLGIVLLPHLLVDADVERGTLEVVMPEWTMPSGVIHAVFPTRRGLVPSVRALIDFLAESFPAQREQCKTAIRDGALERPAEVIA